MISITSQEPENFAEHGVRINTLCPGLTRTDMIQVALKDTKHPKVLQNILDHPATATMS